MTLETAPDSLLHLRRSDTSVVLDLAPRQFPCVLHWGPDLGELSTAALAELHRALTLPFVDSVISSQNRVGLLPLHSSGWLGRPGLTGSREGRAWSTSFTRVDHEVQEAGGCVTLHDGRPLGFARQMHVVASNGVVHEAMLEVIREVK